jgi:hypothetical protein
MHTTLTPDITDAEHLQRLTNLVDQAITSGRVVSPHDGAGYFLTHPAVEDALLLAAVREKLLADFVRERIRVLRNGTEFGDHVRYVDQGSAVTEQNGNGQHSAALHSVSAVPRTPPTQSRKVTAAREQLLNIPYNVPPGSHDWKPLGDMTADDLAAVAQSRRQQAQTLNAKADHLLRVRDALVETGAVRVRDLPVEKFTEVWNK